ncbi:MAG: tetratricopeptide repeat protein [Magnetococcales bacterium]|nr:tetratricopeptide repeat protein [Magnetococcales bacterium]
MSIQPVLTLSIRRTDDEATPYQVSTSFNGGEPSPERAIAKAAYRQVHDVVDGYRLLFKKVAPEEMVTNTLFSAGTELFHLWLAPEWSSLAEKFPAGTPLFLTIASEAPEILNLPWEIMRPPEGQPLGLDSAFSVRRQPKSGHGLAHCCPTLAPAPLRVLFLAASPKDQPVGDLEREQGALLSAFSTLSEPIAFEGIPMGSVAELKSALSRFQPHVVHLAGPALIRKESGHFAFEDDQGMAEVLTADEMAQSLFASSGVQCVVVSGQNDNHPPPVAGVGALCQGLVAAGVPLALGWPLALSRIPESVRLFYRALAGGESLDQALFESRQGGEATQPPPSAPEWSLPAIYAASDQAHIFNAAANAPRVTPEPERLEVIPLPGMDGGYVGDFLGRRREIQQFLPGLCSGATKGVILTGLGGVGKSALAAHLCHQLEKEGLLPVAVAASPGNPITPSRVLEAFDPILKELKLADEQRFLLHHPGIGIGDRLGLLVRMMNERIATVLVLDNLDGDLIPGGGGFKDPLMGRFFFHMLTHLKGKSRLIVTSHFSPDDPDQLPEGFVHAEINSLPEACFLHTLRRDRRVASILDAHRSLGLSELIIRFAGVTPRYLSQIREALKSAPLEEMYQGINEAMKRLDEEPDSRQRGAMREAFCLDRFVSPIYETLSSKARKALSSMALVRLPLTREGIRVVSGLEAGEIDDTIQQWQEQGLIHPHGGRGESACYSVYGFLRLWLSDPARLSDETKKGVHQRAWAWLVEKWVQDLPMDRGFSRISWLAEAARQFTLLGEGSEGVGTLMEMATIDQRLGHLPAAVNWLEQGLEILGETDHGEARAAFLEKVGFLEFEQGNLPKARELLWQAVVIYRESTDQEGLARLLPWMAELVFRLGNPEGARPLYQESLEHLRSTGQQEMEGQVLHQMATLDLNSEEHDRALDGFRQSLAIKRELADKKGEAATFYQLGRLAKAKELQEDSLYLLGVCYQLDREIGDPGAEKELQLFQEIAQALGMDPETAQGVLNQVLEAYQTDGGEALINKVFGKPPKKRKVIPIVAS